MDSLDEKKTVIKAVFGFAVYILLVPALLFLSAGTLNWPMAWAYVMLFL